MIVAALVCYDDTHRIIEDIYKKAHIEERQEKMEIDPIVVDLQRVIVPWKFLRSDYLCLISDKDCSLKVAELYAGQLREKRMRLISSIRSLTMFRRH